MPELKSLAAGLLLANALAVAAAPRVDAHAAGKPAADRVSELRLDGRKMPYPVWFRQVLPSRVLSLKAPSGHVLKIGDERLKGIGDEIWWQAPDRPGIHTLTVLNRDGRTVQTVTIFVLEPSGLVRNGRLNGFRTGRYPTNPPPGYIRLHERDLKARLSPNFRVGQFIVKQQRKHWPKYVVVSENLILRLQTLLDSLRADGVTDAETLFVMSGYRTPFYNTSIGAKPRSRHMWGDASDVYVDVAPRDGVMDDLNRDGRINKADADWLYDYADRLFRSRDVPKGGLGSYRANAVHGPFVHVDGRGRRARWGR